MSKKACSDYAVLKKKMKGERVLYYCKKCEKSATKEKWLCKPIKLK